MKPDIRSYRKRQFSKYPYIVKCNKTGYLFKEVNGETHKFIFRIIATTLIGLLFMLYLYLTHTLSKDILRGTLIYIFLMVLLLSVILVFFARLIITEIFYKVSMFEIIDAKELMKYPRAIISIERTEKRNRSNRTIN